MLVNKRLYIMCGIPGSGKSTFIKKYLSHLEGTSKVISRDQIRFRFLEAGDEYFSKEKEVWREFVKEIRDGIRDVDTTVVDATHLNKASRSKLLHALNLKGITVIAICLDVPLEICLKRNNFRSGREKVPENVIKDMYKNYHFAKIEEGFDEVNIWHDNEKSAPTISIYLNEEE